MSLDKAVERLNVPLTVTGEEAEVLARIPDEWIQLTPFRKQVGEELGRAPTGAVDPAQAGRRVHDRGGRPWLRSDALCASAISGSASRSAEPRSGRARRSAERW